MSMLHNLTKKKELTLKVPLCS